VTSAVLDSSIALTWCFDNETSPETERLLDRVRDDGAIVPALWYIELGNVLLHAEKHGRISTSGVAGRLALLADLPLMTDQETTARSWREILTLARTEGLTTYDATYLELALRYGVPLLTKDKDLADAAGRLGVTVLPDRAARKTRGRGK
jgi:predicted nucleic acid-binding protein